MPSTPANRLRRFERAATWSVAILAAAAGLLAQWVPDLAVAAPGPIGFAAEALASMWRPVSALVAALALGAWTRRHRGPAAVLAAAALLTAGPQLWALVPTPGPPAATGPTLRLASVNLCAEHPADPQMAPALLQLDADVLVLLEVTRAWQARLEPVLGAMYPHRWLAAAPPEPGVSTDGLRVAVWSRLPAAGAVEARHLMQRNSQIRVPLRWRDRTFALYGIHLWKPFPYSLWRSCWRQRRELLAWLDDETLPMVVAGDFNATPRSSFVAALRERALGHAAEQVRGSAPVTWPTTPWWRLPVRVPIDHVMCSAELRPVAFDRGPANGSDHWPVVVELTWSRS
ncbi:MAG: endonuclease/exonuclease/phosphatase family protein [Planctomycetota bacterium]